MHKLFAAVLLAAPLSAQILEDFEHGNENLWIAPNTGANNMDLTAAAAHDGNFGAEFSLAGPSWRVRYELNTAPGNTYDSFVRLRAGTANGRTYLGVGATATGCWSAVFAPNTSQIMLQNNTSSWGFITAATEIASIDPDTWYVLRIEWALNGDMTVHLLDEAGTTTLATTPTTSTGYTTPGGLALRGFTTNSAIFHDIDTIGGPGGGTIGTNYCTPAVANTSGNPASISATGSVVVASNDLTLIAEDMPQNVFGFFLTSQTQGNVPNPGGSQGVLCLGGAIGRYVLPGQIMNSGSAGSIDLALNLNQTPAPGGLVAINVGETWNFQAWFRDLAPGGAQSSNFTDGLSITFQ